MKKGKITFKVIIVLIIVALAWVFFTYDLGSYLSLDNLKAQKQVFETYYGNNRALTITVYMLGYIVITAFSLPGTGGNNESAIHFDFIKDLRQDGRIIADKRTILENGILLI